MSNSLDLTATAIFPLYDVKTDYFYIGREFLGLPSVFKQMSFILDQIEDSKKVFPKKRCFYPEELYLLKDVTQVDGIDFFRVVFRGGFHRVVSSFLFRLR